MKNKEWWAYIAGFLDADGSITAKKMKNRFIESKQYVVSLSQAQEGVKVLNKIGSFLKDKGIKFKIRNNNPKGKGQIQFYLEIDNLKDMVNFLKNAKNYLIIKRVKAIECIRYIEERKEKLSRIHNNQNIAKVLIRNKPWTQDEKNLLKKLRTKGYNNRRISEIMGRSYCAVAHKTYRMNLSTWTLKEINHPRART